MPIANPLALHVVPKSSPPCKEGDIPYAKVTSCLRQDRQSKASSPQETLLPSLSCLHLLFSQSLLCCEQVHA